MMLVDDNDACRRVLPFFFNRDQGTSLWSKRLQTLMLHTKILKNLNTPIFCCVLGTLLLPCVLGYCDMLLRSNSPVDVTYPLVSID